MNGLLALYPNGMAAFLCPDCRHEGTPRVLRTEPFAIERDELEHECPKAVAA